MVGRGSRRGAASLIFPCGASPGEWGRVLSVPGTAPCAAAVTPAVSDGAAGASASPFNTTTNTITVDINGTPATATFAGLAPGLAGLYQLNVTVPSGLTAGNNVLDIAGPDSYNSEAILPVGSGTASSVETPQALRRHSPAVRPLLQRAPAKLAIPKGR